METLTGELQHEKLDSLARFGPWVSNMETLSISGGGRAWRANPLVHSGRAVGKGLQAPKGASEGRIGGYIQGAACQQAKPGTGLKCMTRTLNPRPKWVLPLPAPDHCA